jgi:hypothetical protein
MPKGLALLQDVCAAARGLPLDYGEYWKQAPDEMRQVANTNLLLAPDAGVYKDVTKQWGVSFGGWTWNARFADLNNDTWQDLFMTQGSRLRFNNASNILYRNAGGKRFEDATQAVGLEDHVPSGASLFLDYTMDGRLDIITYPFQLTPEVWRNDAAAGAGFQVELRDMRAANTGGIGARVDIRADDGRIQMREIKASGGYESFDWTVARFGLGDWKTVTWPDGQATRLDGLALTAGRYRLVRTAAP